MHAQKQSLQLNLTYLQSLTLCCSVAHCSNKMNVFSQLRANKTFLEILWLFDAIHINVIEGLSVLLTTKQNPQISLLFSTPFLSKCPPPYSPSTSIITNTQSGLISILIGCHFHIKRSILLSGVRDFLVVYILSDKGIEGTGLRPQRWVDL